MTAAFRSASVFRLLGRARLVPLDGDLVCQAGQPAPSGGGSSRVALEGDVVELDAAAAPVRLGGEDTAARCATSNGPRPSGGGWRPRAAGRRARR